MSAQSVHSHGEATVPPAGTVAELRRSLARYGFPGDLEMFEKQLAEAIANHSTVGGFEAVDHVVRFLPQPPLYPVQHRSHVRTRAGQRGTADGRR